MGTVNSKISDVGPTTHHGQKTMDNYRQYFTEAFVKGNGQDCSVMMRKDTWVKEKEYVHFFYNSMKDRVAGGFQSMAKIAAPYWDFEYLECMKTYSCYPLDHDAPLVLTLPTPKQTAPIFMRITGDLKFEKCGQEHDRCHCTGVVKFGVNTNANKKEGYYNVVPEGQDGIQCNLGQFDNMDPAPGAQKFCYCAAIPK